MRRIIRRWLAIPAADRAIILAVVSLIANLLYAFYHGGLGLVGRSAWLLASGIYYLLLAVARFIAIIYARQHPHSQGIGAAIGLLLFALAGLLGGLLAHSLQQPAATVYGTIPMITIATVTFTKITVAATGAIRHRHHRSLSLHTIHAIRYAEIAVSLYTMQRSMLATFGSADDPGADILNQCTGSGVCVFVIALGIYLMYCSRKEVTTHGNIPSH